MIWRWNKTHRFAVRVFETFIVRRIDCPAEMIGICNSFGDLSRWEKIVCSMGYKDDSIRSLIIPVPNCSQSVEIRNYFPERGKIDGKWTLGGLKSLHRAASNFHRWCCFYPSYRVFKISLPGGRGEASFYHSYLRLFLNDFETYQEEGVRTGGKMISADVSWPPKSQSNNRQSLFSSEIVSLAHAWTAEEYTLPPDQYSSQLSAICPRCSLLTKIRANWYPRIVCFLRK